MAPDDDDAPPSPPPPTHLAFAHLPPAAHAPRWDALYRAATTPWDRAAPSAALADLLDQRPDLVPTARRVPPRSTALVPGCGRGHDVLLLSACGYDVCGLDVSEDAVRLAAENDKSAPREGLLRPRGEGPPGEVRWLAADFFEHAWAQGLGTEGSGKFDLIFDYTFLCALPPELRPRWAKRVSELLLPTGRLVCLEFPSARPLTEPGPPWGLRPEIYEALLTAPGRSPSYRPDGTVVSVASPQPCADALHRLSIIKPARTHKAGMAEDGSVVDFLSVWAP